MVQLTNFMTICSRSQVRHLFASNTTLISRRILTRYAPHNETFWTNLRAGSQTSAKTSFLLINNRRSQLDVCRGNRQFGRAFTPKQSKLGKGKIGNPVAKFKGPHVTEIEIDVLGIHSAAKRMKDVLPNALVTI